jgi:hypothetical protein
MPSWSSSHTTTQKNSNENRRNKDRKNNLFEAEFWILPRNFCKYKYISSSRRKIGFEGLPEGHDARHTTGKKMELGERRRITWPFWTPISRMGLQFWVFFFFKYSSLQFWLIIILNINYILQFLIYIIKLEVMRTITWRSFTIKVHE